MALTGNLQRMLLSFLIMNSWSGKITIADLLRDRNNWHRYIAWQEGNVRESVVRHVEKMLRCRTPLLGAHLFNCQECETVRVVPHSCKSPFCSSCGKARTDEWCGELLSDWLDVPYRHLVFTLPWQLRLPIQDNRQLLLPVLFRAAADTILSLTSGTPTPLGRKSQKYMAGRKRKYTPGIMVVLHTFGSDLKWNVHLHVIVTSGGLSLAQKSWVSGPSRYLVPAPLLGTEWKLRVIKGIKEVYEKNGLHCRPLRGDPSRKVDIPKMLGHVRKIRWHILVGPSLKDAEQVVKYACRYTKRPAIAEGRILNYQNGYVTYRFKDYHKGGSNGVKTLPVLTFIDRLTQHLPEQRVHQVHYYGMLAPTKKNSALAKAHQLLAQRRKRHSSSQTWEARRKAAGEKSPLSCPRCGQRMEHWFFLFGSAYEIAELIDVDVWDKIPPGTFVQMSDIPFHLLVGAAA